MSLSGLKLRRFPQNHKPTLNLHWKAVLNHPTVIDSNGKYFYWKHPRIKVPPTQLKTSIKISKIGFPGNSVKNFIFWDSGSLTQSEIPFHYKKSQLVKMLLGFQPKNTKYILFIYNEHNKLLDKRWNKRSSKSSTNCQSYDQKPKSISGFNEKSNLTCK